jgi:hypothetical protein
MDRAVTGPDGSVMLGYIHGGTVRAEFMASVLNLLSGPGRTSLVGGVVDGSAGPLIAMARNMLVTRFLASDLEWLWFVDSDIVFTTATLETLHEAADPGSRPVMTALYWVLAGGGTQAPAAYTAGPDPDGNLLFSALKEWDPGAVTEVDGCGAGCLLIHRTVLEKLQAADGGRPWWFRELTIGPKEVGEDLSFCARLARESVPLHLHAGVEVGHVKAVQLGTVRP